MAKKPEILHELRYVKYDKKHWILFKSLRKKTVGVMQALEEMRIRSFAYGSIARGDVHLSSDIDIVIPHLVPSFKIELACDGWVHRELVQATPSSVVKGHLYLDENVVITFPLFKMMPREYDFYRWGGIISIDEIKNEVRVMGVDKRLILIEPTSDGHVEYGVIGREYETARRLGVSVDIAFERVRVLKRRDSIGRTGVYLSCVIPENMTFEEVAKKIQDRDPALRRTINRRG